MQASAVLQEPAWASALGEALKGERKWEKAVESLLEAYRTRQSAETKDACEAMERVIAQNWLSSEDKALFNLRGVRGLSAEQQQAKEKVCKRVRSRYHALLKWLYPDNAVSLEPRGCGARGAAAPGAGLGLRAARREIARRRALRRLAVRDPRGRPAAAAAAAARRTRAAALSARLVRRRAVVEPGHALPLVAHPRPGGAELPARRRALPLLGRRDNLGGGLPRAHAQLDLLPAAARRPALDLARGRGRRQLLRARLCRPALDAAAAPRDGAPALGGVCALCRDDQCERLDAARRRRGCGLAARPGVALRARLDAAGALLRATDAANLVRVLAAVPPARAAAMLDAPRPLRRLFVVGDRPQRSNGRALLDAVCRYAAASNATAVASAG